MPRFVHAADLHLDSPLRNLDLKDAAPVAVLREAPRRALEALVRLCLNEAVDFLLLAGDVYDGDWRDFATGQFFCQQMRRLGEIPVFLIRGNHDAANKMTKDLPLPKNVRVFSGKKAESHTLDELQVAIHGQSFQEQEARDNLVRDYPAPTPGWLNIGLLHTSLEGSAVHGTYAPCGVEQLVNKGYDYWALGHIHQREVVNTSPAIVFPGNIQGRHVREVGPKGAYLVTLTPEGKSELDFRRLDVARWEVIEHIADPRLDRDELFAQAIASLRELAAREAEEDRLVVVRFRIRGASAAHATLQARTAESAVLFRESLQNELGEKVWLESVRFETTPPVAGTAENGTDDATAELSAVIAEFAADHQKLQAVAASLNILKDKLPSSLVNGDEPLDPSDPDWLAGLLGRVLPVLTDAGAGGDKS